MTLYTAEQISNAMAQMGPETFGKIIAEPDGEGGLWRITIHADLQEAFGALDLSDARPRLIAYAADLRWRKEVSGVEISGIPVATDDRSKLMIMAARVAASADPAWTTVWHGADGQTYSINASAMIAISDEVQARINATFVVFASVKAAIEAGTITTAAEIDAAFA